MLPFLRKHFGLSSFVEQPNNFVVFDAFFDAGPPPRRSEVDSPTARERGARRVQGTI